MGTTIFMALAMLTVLVLAGVGLYLLAQLMINFSPGKRKIQEDIRKMKAEIRPWFDELVPWDKDEMELFSHNQTRKVVKKGVTTTAKGIFTSIYHEPMLAYSYKKYVSSGENAVLYARTSNHEFVYRIRKKGVQVVIDNQLVGTLDKEGVLRSARTNNLLAKINKESEQLLLPVLVNNKEVASLVNPKMSDQPIPRAFELLEDNMSTEEEKVFLSMAVFEMVKQSMK